MSTIEIPVSRAKEKGLFRDFQRFLLYFYVPHLFAQWAIVSINLVQHDGCDVVPIGSPTSGKEVTNFNIARNLTGWLINYLTMKCTAPAATHQPSPCPHPISAATDITPSIIYIPSCTGLCTRSTTAS